MAKKKTLHPAAEKGDLELVKQLIAEGSEINQQNPWGLTPLYKAFCSGNDELINYLIEQGADEWFCKEGSTMPICYHYVLMVCDHKWINYFIEKGLDSNVLDEDGSNSLYNLFSSSHYSATTHKLLLDAGCNPETENKFGYSAMSYLNNCGIKELIDLYSNYTGKIEINENIQDIRNQYGESILFETVEKGSSKELRKLLKKNPKMDLNKYDKMGETAISNAIILQKKNTAKVLLEYGANPFIPHKYNEDWPMPLAHAEDLVERGLDKFKEIVEIIKTLPNKT